MKQARPRSVTIIACLLIAPALIRMLRIFTSATPNFLVVDSLVLLVMGFGIFYGLNWARLLLLWLVPAAILAQWLLGESFPRALAHFILYLVYAWYLTRPTALEYFTGKRVTDLN